MTELDQDIEKLCVDKTISTEMAFRTLTEEVQKLRDAIRLHRDEKGHDRCFLDDRRLYAALPEGLGNSDQSLPEKCEFLANCERYWEHRRDPSRTFIREADLVKATPTS